MPDTVTVFGVDLRNKVRQDFPFVQGAWVEFYDDITMGSALEINTSDASVSAQESLQLLVNQIADWNFADSNGKAEISIENLKKLGSAQIKWMMEQVQKVIEAANAVAEDEKKVSPAS